MSPMALDPIERIKAMRATMDADREARQRQEAADDAEVNSDIAKLLLDPARAATSDLIGAMIYLSITGDEVQLPGVIAELDLRIPPRCTDEPSKVVDDE